MRCVRSSCLPLLYCVSVSEEKLPGPAESEIQFYCPQEEAIERSKKKKKKKFNEANQNQGPSVPVLSIALHCRPNSCGAARNIGLLRNTVVVLGLYVRVSV